MSNDSMNDPIVEETRRLRDEYAARHGYNIHQIVKDLQEWEQQGFPMAANPHSTHQPIVVPSLKLESLP